MVRRFVPALVRLVLAILVLLAPLLLAVAAS